MQQGIGSGVKHTPSPCVYTETWLIGESQGVS